MARWRIGVVQVAPELGQVEKNTQKVIDVTSKLRPGSLDLLCMPEMVLTGYTFPSAEAIRPYLEHPETGPTSICCRDLAKRLRCHVMAGYPEAIPDSDSDSDSSDNLVGYNSALIYGPDGKYLGGYRKTNLFNTDMPWARAGDGFQIYNLGDILGRISLGICMDLNPFPSAVWTSLDDGPYELAAYVKEQDTRLLVILCAWLDSKDDPAKRWDLRTADYWLTRLLPLWYAKNGTTSEKETIVVVCNRCGSEDDTLFAGTSAIFRLIHGEKPQFIGIMSRTEEDVRVWEV
ncbi:hypothetical protein M422DRAFT_24696 [Sphaerobolus stellatus SS14]|nr:hypothetical protein M422DRAFT_24696 [Sphaerobolus stellatus SS14]